MEASVAGQSIIKETLSSSNSLSEETFVVMGEAEYESLPTNNLRIHMLAGAAAGVVEHCTVYPVDCVKVIYDYNSVIEVVELIVRLHLRYVI